MPRNNLPVLLGILVLLGLAGLCIVLTPRITSVSPSPGATQVSGGSPLRITFSRRMQTQSVAERLKIEPATIGDFEWESANSLVFSPQKAWPSGAQIRVTLGAGSKAAGLFALPTLGSKSWSFTIGSPRLVYLYPANSPANLVNLNPLDGQITNLTDLPAGIADYTLSSNGALITLTADEEDSSRIYRFDLGSQKLIEWSRFPQAQVRSACLVSNEQYLVYEQTELGAQPEQTQVWLQKLIRLSTDLALDGSPMQTGDSRHQNQQPECSAAGWISFYDATAQAYVLYNPDSQEKINVPSQTGQDSTWSPDGLTFVFPEIQPLPANSNAAPASHLLAYHLDSRAIEDLSHKANVEDAAPVFAPGGKQLVFARKYLDAVQWTPGRQIWLMQLDTGVTYSILSEPQYNHYAFNWSPDGQSLAYVRFDAMTLTHPPEIWLLQLEGFRSRQLVAGGYLPAWIP